MKAQTRKDTEIIQDRRAMPLITGAITTEPGLPTGMTGATIRDIMRIVAITPQGLIIVRTEDIIMRHVRVW